MTVINMLSFGESGIAMADEQSSTALRKYNVAQKLQTLYGNVLYGGSGPADPIKEIYEISEERINLLKQEKGNISIREIFEIVNEITISYHNNLKNRILNARIGISLEDFLTGTLTRIGKPLDETIKNYAARFCQQMDEEGSIEILLGGINLGKFVIYRADSYGYGFKISRPYDSIGSGKDESEKVLSSYVSHLPRGKRESIDRNEGLIKIIEATNASSRLNIGVGGAPSIVYISEGSMKRPNENQCILASEIVEGLTRDLLEKDFVHESLSKLVFNNGDFEEIEEEVKQKSKDWKKLDRILRGYKE